MYYNPYTTFQGPDTLRNKADKFAGKRVKDTYNRVGSVKRAVVRGNLVVLHVVSEDGSNEWTTDTEHATLLRDDHSPTYEINPLNRGELEES